MARRTRPKPSCAPKFSLSLASPTLSAPEDAEASLNRSTNKSRDAKIDIIPISGEKVPIESLRKGPLLGSGAARSPSTKDVDISKRTYIQLDDTMESPMIGSSLFPYIPYPVFPSVGSNSETRLRNVAVLAKDQSSSASELPQGYSSKPGKQFFQVDKTNLFVFIDETPLIKEDGTFNANTDLFQKRTNMEVSAITQETLPLSKDDVQSIIGDEAVEDVAATIDKTEDQILHAETGRADLTCQDTKNETAGTSFAVIKTNCNIYKTHSDINDSEKAAPSSSVPVISLKDLKILECLGHGQQGSVYKCVYKDQIYALKKLPLESVGSGGKAGSRESDVVRHARKISIIRELKMVAAGAQKGNRKRMVLSSNNDENLTGGYLVSIHNAYFKNNELLILMELMGTRSVETVIKMASRISSASVITHLAKDSFGKQYQGDKNIIANKQKTANINFSLNHTNDLRSSQIFMAQNGIGNTSKKVTEGARVNRSTGLPEIVASMIGCDILKGLVQLHNEYRVVHTDLKTSNILFAPNNRYVKIADFGCSVSIADTLDSSFATSEADRDRAINNRPVLGTKLYMPPDRVQAEMWAQADNYAFLQGDKKGKISAAPPPGDDDNVTNISFVSDAYLNDQEGPFDKGHESEVASSSISIQDEDKKKDNGKSKKSYLDVLRESGSSKAKILKTKELSSKDTEKSHSSTQVASLNKPSADSSREKDTSTKSLKSNISYKGTEHAEAVVKSNNPFHFYNDEKQRCPTNISQNGFSVASKAYSDKRGDSLSIFSTSNSGFIVDEKADIWSFGILLLEMVDGCHPCEVLMRDSYWNYADNLRFQNMIKPEECSDLLLEVLFRSLAPLPEQRATAVELLELPFFKKYNTVDRAKFATFLNRLEKESNECESREHNKELSRMLTSSLKEKASSDYYAMRSRVNWAGYNSAIRQNVIKRKDEEGENLYDTRFPSLH